MGVVLHVFVSLICTIAFQGRERLGETDTARVDAGPLPVATDACGFAEARACTRANPISSPLERSILSRLVRPLDFVERERERGRGVGDRCADLVKVCEFICCYREGQHYCEGLSHTGSIGL